MEACSMINAVAFTVPGEPQGKALQRVLREAREQGGCWMPSLKADRKGYVRVKVERRSVPVHRLAYSLLRGPIPDGLTIDHLCRNPSCFNPQHLEPVTVQENIRRGTQGQKQAAKSHCIRGHEFTASNTYRPPGKNERNCRECMRMHGRKNDAIRRANGRRRYAK
jgi:hypothetical protein